MKLILTLASKLVSLQYRMHSLPSTVAALRGWHAHAVTVCSYNPEESFPPKSEEDICNWITVFANEGTAYNYVGVLRFIGVMTEADNSHWDGELLQQKLKGIPKRRFEHEEGHLWHKKILDELPAL